MAQFNSHPGGFLYSLGGFEDRWDLLALPATDLYSNWVRVDRIDGGFLAFQYKIVNNDWAGDIIVQATNAPESARLDPEAVVLSTGGTAIAVSAGTDAVGIISLRKRAKYYRLFLDRSAGTTGNTVSAAAHQ